MSPEKDIYQRFDSIERELIALNTSLIEIKLDLETINQKFISQSRVTTNQPKATINTNVWSSNILWFVLGVTSFIFGYHLFDILELFSIF